LRYFVLTNDPDHGKTEDYKLILRELSKNNIFVTTAVFCTLKDDKSALAKHCHRGDTDTLDVKEYRELMIEAKDLGHEIAFHGYSQVSDTRDEFQKGLDIFKKIFREYSKVYIEHGGHIKFHPKNMVKKENLSLYGNNEKTEYYIKDIIYDVFDLVWTHNYLRDDLNEPIPLDKIFVKEDGITYFNRWRMYNFNQIKNKINDIQNVFIGYTHFGYTGYKRSGRNFLLNFYKNFFDKNSYYERWLKKDLKVIIRLLKNDLLKNNFKSYTISQLFEEYNNK
jgi:hypothetical protein